MHDRLAGREARVALRDVACVGKTNAATEGRDHRR
jgi:hypothetical protein